MSDFKWRDFRGEIILVDQTTLYRWVQHYAPEMEKRLRCIGNLPWATVGEWRAIIVPAHTMAVAVAIARFRLQ